MGATLTAIKSLVPMLPVLDHCSVDLQHETQEVRLPDGVATPCDDINGVCIWRQISNRNCERTSQMSFGERRRHAQNITALERRGLEFQSQFARALPRNMKLGARWSTSDLGISLPVLVARRIAEIVGMETVPSRSPAPPARARQSIPAPDGCSIRRDWASPGGEWKNPRPIQL